MAKQNGKTRSKRGAKPSAVDLVADLATRMTAMRKAGGDPYVLLLGAGASIASGTSLNRAVVERVVGTYDVPKFDAFLRRCSADEKFGLLRELVEGALPSKGYHALAELVRAGYFDIVLSTNFDPLLEDAISAQRMRRRDYVLLINGVMSPELVATHLARREPRVKLVKLHGDLFYRSFLYTGDEIDEFPDAIEAALRRFLNQHNLVVVGHAMSDQDINRCLSEVGESIWYVNRREPQPGLARVLRSRNSAGNAVVGDAGDFEAFFTRLRDLLLREGANASVDEIAQSIFTVAAPRGLASGCGFLVGDTGLVVTDTTILADSGIGTAVGSHAELRSFAGGPSVSARLAVAPKSTLDFVVFRLESGVPPSPLLLAPELPKVGDAVTVCISHGQTQGFHDARVLKTGCVAPVQNRLGRLERVSDLIELNLTVAEGSCGSPVVAKNGRVVGVVVAGDDVLSYALPATQLRKKLERDGLIRRGVT